MINFKKGFTLIELLVVISIIAILVGVSIFGLAGARESARDARRKSDLELIRSGLELYKADCNDYPPTANVVLNGIANLNGDGSPATSCPVGNRYISGIPADPIPATRSYRYVSAGTSYLLCAYLENAPSPLGDITGCGTCGSAGNCNYKVTNP